MRGDHRLHLIAGLPGYVPCLRGFRHSDGAIDQHRSHSARSSRLVRASRSILHGLWYGRLETRKEVVVRKPILESRDMNPSLPGASLQLQHKQAEP